MFKPQEVFNHPENFWNFLTAPKDEEFEGQYFERKQAGRVDDRGNVSGSQLSKLQKQIQETVSAFANTNHAGGLLVLGINTQGEVTGIDHLTEEQINSLTNISSLLKNQSARVKEYACKDKRDEPKTICFIYTPYTERLICETPEHSPKAWERHGKQNILLKYEQYNRLKRDKGILDFEMSSCCSFYPEDVDQGILQEFRRFYLADAGWVYKN